MKNNEERVKSIMKKVELYKKKRGEIISAVTLGVCMAVLVVAGASLNSYRNSQNGEIIAENTETSGEEDNVISKEGELLVFASKEELINKFEEQSKKYESQRKYLYRNSGIMVDDMVFTESAEIATNSAKSAPTFGDTSQSDDYSKTNVQTDGVDEADIIKTDGKKIYYMNSERKDVKIFEDVNGKISLIKTIKLKQDEDGYCYGDSMFIDNNYLIVISHYSKRLNSTDETKEMEGNMAKRIVYEPYRSKSFTKISVYDISTYDLIREIETEGSLVSSRKIGNNLYLVSNKYIYYYSFYKDDVIPLYKDTIENSDYCEVDISSIRAFKDFENDENCNYMIVTALNLADNNSKANISTYIGAGNEIYCSTNNLYVTRSNYNYKYYDVLVNDLATTDTNQAEPTISTNIHKFAISDGKATYIATGKVKGTLLNQFSMDEYQKNFRITTTDDEGNNLYILDENLKQIGRLENLAKGERIYSTRFMGNKAYVVTYKTVDPLFVIDLKEPTNPKVLGELKIPGYSSYLHPLGENYLLGFGEDSVEKSYINWEGKQDVVAYATGLKMAIFDVSDYSNPKEMHSVKIGGRGSYSELLHNHKVLLLDEAKKIFAFPVRVNKEAGYYEDGTPMYGDIDFEGALVYNMDIENGFSLKGKITHDAETRYSKFGNIERIIYIGDKFYTVSNGMIKSTDMNTMQEVAHLKF